MACSLLNLFALLGSRDERPVRMIAGEPMPMIRTTCDAADVLEIM
jgi:hypothetical protein